MKKHFFLFLLSFLILSCSKGGKVILTGKVNNGGPLERIELIESSGVATLPIVNFGVDAKGQFSQTVEIPKDGAYILTYAGKTSFIYLKGGDKVDLSIDALVFPQGIKIAGDAKGNTEYIMEGQQYINEYLSKLDQSVLLKKEADFLKELDKYKSDINKRLQQIAQNKKPDRDVEKFNEKELDVAMLIISSQYQNLHGQFANDPSYKPSEAFLAYQKKLEDEDYVVDMPSYRRYLTNLLGKDIQKYIEKNKNTNFTSNTQVFAQFLETQKQFSQQTKDYLIAAIAAQFDLQPGNPKLPELLKFLENKIQNSTVKGELKKVEEAIYGLKIGTDYSQTELTAQDGKKTSLSSLKGKPTAVVFYASWNPYLPQNTVPVLKEMLKYYGKKINFAFVNLDDTQAQFVKTSKSVFVGLNGSHFYGNGGLSSEIAKQFAIYGFKMPSFVILDKEGKVMSKSFLNIGDPELVDALNKASGMQTLSASPMPQVGFPGAPAGK